MSDHRYPADVPIKEKDFDECGWAQALEAAKREGYSSMWQAFSAAAREAVEAGRAAQGKVLWLLADACSMMLSPKSPNEPFKPFAILEGKRSVIPDDLGEHDVAFFANVVGKVDDPRLKARLADLVWLKQQPRDVRFALDAIDAYQRIPLDEGNWLRDGRQCWERALTLTLLLGKGAGDRLEEMEKKVLDAFDAASHEQGFLALWLAELLEKYRLARDSREPIAKKLEQLASVFAEAGDLHRSRDYYDAAARWFELAGDMENWADCVAAVAESWAKEAVARTAADQPSYMAAATFYENAIQTYRRIPRAYREPREVGERIDDLRNRLNECGERSLGEMGEFSTPGVDVSELVDYARDAVRGKEAIEALRAFAALNGGAKKSQLRQQAMKRLGEFPLQALSSATFMSRDGRVIAKRPGLSFGGEPTEEDEVVIRASMIQDYGAHVAIAVQGEIWPALQVLLLEHRLQEQDFVHLAKQSPIVPKGREGLFGKALFAGYDRDFAAALHLMIPQVEHMVRCHLKAAGATTTNLDNDGIENENGLSTLMDMSEADTVFGEDIAFEIRSLFCDPFGPNLRNELAHGLLEEDTCHSIYAVYAWWLGLRLVFNAFWIALQKQKAREAHQSADGNAG